MTRMYGTDDLELLVAAAFTAVGYVVGTVAFLVALA